LDLYAHTRHWPEPADWASKLEPLLADDGPEIARVRAALAAEAAHQGDYQRAVELATSAAEADDPHTRASAWETLSDVATYNGDLTTSIAAARRLVDLGEEHDDPYSTVIGVTCLSLAATFGGDHSGGLRLLADLVSTELSPSSRAWLAYSEGECRAATDPTLALQCYEKAIELGTSVNHRLVAGVAIVARLTLQARAGEPDQALAQFEPVLRDYRRTGDASHSITALRNLIDLLTRVGDDEMAMELLGALSSHDLKATYGEESERLITARNVVEARHGVDVAAGWRQRTTGRGYRWALDAAIGHLTEQERRRRTP
jgi:tetratricopeptide (TPR) repeat protein